MTQVRIIGDVHGKLDQYLKLVDEAEYSVQVGDLGFNYEKLERLDPTRHRVVGGNHDNYDNLSAHFLKDFGVHKLGNFEFFYVRGAFSIDFKRRTPGIDWFPAEEISHYRWQDIIDLYKKEKPKFVITHTCPEKFVTTLGNPRTMRHYGFTDDCPGITEKLLTLLAEIHVPEMWVFGHFHRTWGSGAFTCLDELAYMDIEVDELNEVESINFGGIKGMRPLKDFFPC